MRFQAAFARPTLFSLAGLLIGTSMLVGCGSIRVVRKTPNGGEVALEPSGTREQSHQKAEEYMAAQCPNGYEILEEGEAVVGQEMTSQTTATRDIFGRPSATSAASTTDKREWRIKYQCKGTTPPASADGAGAKPSARGPIYEVRVAF